MKRTITTDRLYSLGDYRNIRFIDVIDEIPDKLLLNKDYMGAVKFLQLISIEVAFRHYLKLMEEHPISTEQAAIEALETIRQTTIESIKAITNGDLEV